MALIEGVGDEVTIFVGILVLLVILTLAWISTGVTDRPFVSVIVLDRRTFQHFLSRLRGRGRRVIASSLGTTSEETTPTSEDTGDSSATTTPVSTPTTQNETEPASDNNGEEILLSPVTIHSRDESPPIVEASPASTPGSEGFVHVATTEGEKDTEPVVEASPLPPVSPESTCEEPDQPVLRQRRLAFFNRDQAESDIKVNATPVESTSRTEETAEVKSDTPEQASSQGTPDFSSGSQANSQEGEEAEEFAPIEGHIRIRLKYLDDRQRWVQAKPEDTIGHFKRTHFSTEMTGNTVVRIIFNGRELSRENASLASYNVGDESVVHCLVSQVAPQDTDTLNRQQPLDIGSLMFPLFGLILALLWYSRFTYKQFFNTMSTLTLVGISFLFLVALFASFRHNEAQETEAN